MIRNQEMLERLLGQLPERRTPQLLFERLTRDRPQVARVFELDPALLSDVLTLAAWSPLLSTTLENNPDYVSWLQRERASAHVRSCEELGESLARFALVHSQLDRHVMLARFRRRELLRTYLHDIRKTRTIVETTEELSNLADAVLDYALTVSRQALDNRYGSPQTTNAQGKIAGAEFCIIALGKLGSFELNYSSDIDLVFLFSEDGLTAAGGARGQITNREYFVRLGESLLRLVSEATGEGASYRIDVRLRPYGGQGALACALTEALNYYRESAQDWELQTLIRSHVSAGSKELYARFTEGVTGRVFRPDVTVERALNSVRTAKDKIDQQRERNAKGFDVKLGRGGIREIEFIAQALQIAFGGRDLWVRAPHTLISLGRLADRELITKQEHSQLSDAYRFLRMLEHRLQMEHGLQTHSLPTDAGRRELVARRMDFTTDRALEDFEKALSMHTNNVRAAFDRIFRQQQIGFAEPQTFGRRPMEDPSAARDIARVAARMLFKHLNPSVAEEQMADIVRAQAAGALNPQRALSLLTRFAASLEKETPPDRISEAELRSLIQLCGVSEVFGEMIARRPALIHSLDRKSAPQPPGNYQPELSNEVTNSFAGDLEAIRRKWSALLVGIGERDSAGELSLSDANNLLTRLAVASVDASLVIAERELERRYQGLVVKPRLAVLALGRLGSGGMDYGSDLDVILVYDANTQSPVADLTHEEAYARLTEFIVAALSAITREGFLYRVDLRLRPDGQKGLITTSAESFINYVQKRAQIWEWLAYVKLRAVAGQVEFGRSIEESVCKSIHERALNTDRSELAFETRRVRERLEKEKTARVNTGINIKHGPGGMMDVYFATRYLQLRDNVLDDGEDRSTLNSLRRLRGAGSIDETSFSELHDGYRFLRSVDHQARLIVGRSATLPLSQQPALADIARRVGLTSDDELAVELKRRMHAIRRAYDRITSSE